jgi:hypothetical protein
VPAEPSESAPAATLGSTAGGTGTRDTSTDSAPPSSQSKEPVLYLTGFEVPPILVYRTAAQHSISVVPCAVRVHLASVVCMHSCVSRAQVQRSLPLLVLSSGAAH